MKEALDLDDVLSRMESEDIRKANADGNDSADDDMTLHNVDSQRVSAVDKYLLEKCSDRVGHDNIVLSSHERSVKAQVIKDFVAINRPSGKKCESCGAISPGMRQDASNKIFQTPLSGKSRKNNDVIKAKITPASTEFSTDANIHREESSEEEQTDDDESSDSEDEGVLKGKKESDKFVHPLEVFKQVEITWKKNPVTCYYVFGSAHAPTPQTAGHSIFFSRVVSVTPARFRPPMSVGSMTVEHSQNFYLNKIIAANLAIRESIANEKAASASSDPDSDSDSDYDYDTDSDSDPDSAAHTKNGGTATKTKKLTTSQLITTWIDLQTNYNCYFDSAKDPTAASTERVPPGIRQLLERKEGIFRKHMMGKRVNFACRSVISPDPYIGTNEIGLPVKFAKTLTYTTPVTVHNIDEMRQLVTNGPDNYPGAVWVEEASGRRFELARMSEIKREAFAARLLSGSGQMKVGRQLRDGDMVLMNRQPTLHKPGIMAHRVRVLHSQTQQTIRMHYANCNTYNADYDGDEMNCHFPQTDLARAEAEYIASNDLQYIVPTDGSPLRGLIQDHVDGGVKMCCKNAFFDRETVQQLLFGALAVLPGLEVIADSDNITLVPPAIIAPKELWTGKQVVTCILQAMRKHPTDPAAPLLPGISMERKTKTPANAFGESMLEHMVLVRNGELLRGVLDKAAFGATEFSLVHSVQESYGPAKAGLLLNSFGRLFTAYIQYYAGHSCRMEDLLLTSDADVVRQNLIAKAYNRGMHAAKQWADATAAKTEINEAAIHDFPLPKSERASTAAKIGSLLRSKEGKENAASLDGYMQSKLNPIGSDIIKTSLPNGLAVPFPANTFSLMVTTGAKGSMVNQSQVSCLLGQQALEGRRVPRQNSGRTLPSFLPFDPDPRADGFITDRFLTGVRPQEYYFHCMAGREGLVDTAVKTSRSGYLQRCLVKHLEELKIGYDHTVRDSEGNVVQFLYGEDGIDPTKAAYLDCSSNSYRFFAKNNEMLRRTYHTEDSDDCTLKVAYDDKRNFEKLTDFKAKWSAGDYENIKFKKSQSVLVRTFKSTDNMKRVSDLSASSKWVVARIVKAHKDGKSFDIEYKKPGIKEPVKVAKFPLFVKDANKNKVPVLKIYSRDPILSDSKRGRIGVSGKCVSELVASKTRDALEKDSALISDMANSGVNSKQLEKLVASKFISALAAPGEAVGSIAAQSVGEPSTQMTLNTFHLAGAGANVTLGIPRLREIIMTASKNLKTPIMTAPFVENVLMADKNRTMRKFNKLMLKELLCNVDGVVVRETLERSGSGLWDRCYNITLKLFDEERIKEAFGLDFEFICDKIEKVYLKRLKAGMKKHMGKMFNGEIMSGGSAGGVGESDKMKDDGDSDSDSEDEAEGGKKGEEYDNEEGNEEDGTTGRYGHKKELATYGDMDEAEMKDLADDAKERSPKKRRRKSDEGDDDEEDTTDNSDSSSSSSEDERDQQKKKGSAAKNKTKTFNLVSVNHKTNEITLPTMKIDPATKPLLMVEIAMEAAAQTSLRSVPGITTAAILGDDLQVSGMNFQEMWKLENIVHEKLKSNDTYAMLVNYGVEAARANIVGEIKGVFAPYGISVDMRHLTLIADYMTFGGEYMPMNRRGMDSCSSPFLQMSFETTCNFLTTAAMHNEKDNLVSPSGSIVLGKPIKFGTGGIDCIVSVEG